MSPADRVLDAALYALPRVSEALKTIEEGTAASGDDVAPPVRRDLILLRASLGEAAGCVRRIVAALPARA